MSSANTWYANYYSAANNKGGVGTLERVQAKYFKNLGYKI